MDTRAKGRIWAILLSLTMVFTMMPMMAAPAYADDEIPECTVTLDPGIIGGDPVIVKSTDEGMLAPSGENPNNGQFEWDEVNSIMYYRYPQIPSSFAVPDNIQFAGWTSTKWSDVENPGYYISFENATDNHATLTAQWNVAFITFDPGEGSGTTDRELVAKDEPYTVPECGFTAPDGKVFKGWNTAAEGTSGNSGTWYYPGNILTPSQDVTLYARWRDLELSIFPYDKTNEISNNWCGAVIVDDEDEQISNTWWNSVYTLPFSKGSECTAAVAPDNGYRFCGWYKGEYISTAGDELDARPDMDQLITTDRSYKFTVDSDLVFCPVFEEDDLINRVSIVNISTDPNLTGAFAFAGEVDPNEISPTGKQLSDYIELTESWISTDGQDVLSSEDATCIPVTGKTYKYAATITAKGDNVFDTENGFLFFCNGTEYDYADLNVTFSNDKKTATISGFIPDQTAKTVDLKDAEISGLAAKTYNGKAQTQDPVVKMDVNGTQVILENGIDYDVSYSNNVNAGTATVTITGKGDYTGTASATFKINKANNPLAMKPKTAKVKYKKLKKKAQPLAVSKVITFTKNAKDKKNYTLSYAKKGKKSFKKYFAINKTTGKVTVKKGLKKGTYKVQVKVKALGNANYNASAWKTVTFKVVVK